MPTIYLDACCLNRPFDDLTQDRVRLESEAVLIILSHIETGEWEWIIGDPLLFEISQNPDEAQRRRVRLITNLAKRRVSVGDKERDRAARLMAIGFHAFDALHIACAETGSADVLLTTDDQMLQRTARVAGQLRVRIMNPLVWLSEVVGK